MKQLLTIVTLLCCTFLFSCSNSEYNDINGGEVNNTVKQAVSFSISNLDFQEAITRSASNAVGIPIKDANLDFLGYYVYKKTSDLPYSDTTTPFYHSKKYYDLTDFPGTNRLDIRNFSEIKDTLPNGKYIISFFAYAKKQSYIGHTMENPFTSTSINLVEAFDRDVFFTSFEFTVGNTPIKQEIVLPHVIAKLDILIKDAASIPTNIKNVKFSLRNDVSTILLFNDLTTRREIGPTPGDLQNYFWNFKTIDRNIVLAMNDNNYLELYMLPFSNVTNKKADLAVSFEYTDNTISDPIIIKKDLQLYSNKKVVLSGNLFTSSTTLEDIKVDTNWAEVTEASFD